MHFFTFRLKIIFDPPPGGPHPWGLQWVLWTCWERADANRRVIVCLSFWQDWDCHRRHRREFRRFYVDFFFRTLCVRISDLRTLSTSDFDLRTPCSGCCRHRTLWSVAWRFADPAALCCRLSLPLLPTLSGDFKTVSQPLEVCVFLFRRKIGYFGYSFGLWECLTN